MLFQLMQKHIDQGIRGRCRNCPVALAVKEVFPVQQVEVYTRDVSIDSYIYRLPSVVHYAIRTFDLEGTMLPFEFELDIPEGRYV